MRDANHWWREAALYQLLVPSFKDSDGDGYGDLGGVIEQLDYMEWLGIDAIWLSPIYRSPLRELGYDVSDYLDVDARRSATGSTDDRVTGCAGRTASEASRARPAERGAVLGLEHRMGERDRNHLITPERAVVAVLTVDQKMAASGVPEAMTLLGSSPSASVRARSPTRPTGRTMN